MKLDRAIREFDKTCLKVKERCIEEEKGAETSLRNAENELNET